MCWHVGIGMKIAIREDAWAPGSTDYKIQNCESCPDDLMVADLIESNTKS